MELGYNNYLEWEIQKNGNSGNTLRIYAVESKTNYKIGDSESKRIDLLLKDMVLNGNPPNYS